MTRLDEPDFWVDDLYDMTVEELVEERDHYSRLARHGPNAENKAYRYAYYRHRAASDLIEKIRSKDK